MPVAVLSGHVLVTVLKNQNGGFVHLDRVLLSLGRASATKQEMPKDVCMHHEQKETEKKRKKNNCVFGGGRGDTPISWRHEKKSAHNTKKKSGKKTG